MNKSIILRIFLVALVFAPGPFLFTATAEGQSGSSSAASPLQPPSPDEMASTLAAKLNLSDDQKTKIAPIIADRQQKIQSLRADTSMRPMQKMRKMKGIFEDSDKKIEAVLNDEQKKQYVAMEQELRQQMRSRMQNRGSSGAGNLQ